MALTAWNKVWHSGNDGSGSGMDADTVDGYPFFPLTSGGIREISPAKFRRHQILPLSTRQVIGRG